MSQLSNDPSIVPQTTVTLLNENPKGQKKLNGMS